MTTHEEVNPTETNGTEAKGVVVPTVEDMFIEVLNGRSDISTITTPDGGVMLGTSSVIELTRDLVRALAARTDMDETGETLEFLANRRDSFHGYNGFGTPVDHDAARRYEILMDVIDPTGEFESEVSQ